MAGVFGQVDKVTKYPEIELEVKDGITYNLCKGDNINIHASLIQEYTWDCLDIMPGSSDVDEYSIRVYWDDTGVGTIIDNYCSVLHGNWVGGDVNHTFDYPGIYNIVVICTYPDAPGDYKYIDSTIYSATVIVTDCSTPATTTTTTTTSSTTSSPTPPTTLPPNLCPMPDVPETPAFPPPYSLPTTQTSNPLDINNVSVVAINPLVDKIITTTTTTTTSTTTSTTIHPTSTTINIAPCKTGCKSLNF